MASLETKMQISRLGIEGLGPAQQKGLLNQLRQEFREMAPRILPPTIEASSSARMETILGLQVTFDESDPEYNRLCLEIWLKNVLLAAAMDKQLPPLDEQRRRAMTQTISSLRSGIEAVMLDKLKGHFDREEMVSRLDAQKEALIQSIDRNDLTYAFRQPVGNADVEAIVTEFEARLSEGMERVRTRLGQADRIQDPEQKAKYLLATREAILSELVSRPFRVLAHATADPAIRDVDPDSIVPGYRQSVRRRSEMYARLRQRTYLERDALRERQETESRVQEASRKVDEGLLHPRIEEIANSLPESVAVAPPTTHPAPATTPASPAMRRTTSIPVGESDTWGGTWVAILSACLALVLVAGAVFLRWRHRGISGREQGLS